MLPVGGEDRGLGLLRHHGFFRIRPHEGLRFGKISLLTDAVVRIRAESTAEPGCELEMHQEPMLHADAMERVSDLETRLNELTSTTQVDGEACHPEGAS